MPTQVLTRASKQIIAFVAAAIVAISATIALTVPPSAAAMYNVFPADIDGNLIGFPEFTQ